MAKVRERVAPTGKTLDEIAQDRQTLDEFLLENEGELSPEIEELLRDNDMEAKVKIARVAQYIEIETAFAEGIRQRAVALSKRAGAIVSRVDWYKNAYIARSLSTLGLTLAGDRIDAAEAVVRVQLNNPRLDGEIDDDTAFEMFKGARTEKYVKRTVTYTVDRNALLRDGALDATLLPEGVTIVRDASVRIA